MVVPVKNVHPYRLFRQTLEYKSLSDEEILIFLSLQFLRMTHLTISSLISLAGEKIKHWWGSKHTFKNQSIHDSRNCDSACLYPPPPQKKRPHITIKNNLLFTTRVQNSSNTRVVQIAPECSCEIDKRGQQASANASGRNIVSVSVCVCVCVCVSVSVCETRKSRVGVKRAWFHSEKAAHPCPPPSCLRRLRSVYLSSSHTHTHAHTRHLCVSVCVCLLWTISQTTSEGEVCWGSRLRADVFLLLLLLLLLLLVLLLLGVLVPTRWPLADTCRRPLLLFSDADELLCVSIKPRGDNSWKRRRKTGHFASQKRMSDVRRAS